MDVMQLRRGLMMAKKSQLPSEYQEVEYLQSSGAEYIDTGIIGRQNIEAEVIIAFMGNTSNSRIMGSRQNSSATRFYLISRVDNKWHMGIGSDKTSAIMPVTVGEKYVVSAQVVNGNIMMKVNGIVVIETTATYAGTTYPMYLFGANNYGTLNTPSIAKIYSAKITQDDVKVLDFIPCVRKSDNKPGMYDTVRKTFYTNSGTGEFIVPS